MGNLAMALDQKLINAYRTPASPEGADDKALPPRPDTRFDNPFDNPPATTLHSQKSQHFFPTAPAAAAASGTLPQSHVDDAAAAPNADVWFYPSRSSAPSRSDSELPIQNPRSSRISFVSIVDDPFFLQYRTSGEDEEHDNFHSGPGISPDTSDTNSLSSPRAAAESVAPDAEPPHNESGRNWPPPRRESLTIGQFFSWSKVSHEMASLNIAVIGVTGVGKSGFIERAMGLSRPPLSNALQARKVVDGVPYLVTVLELDLEYFELNPDLPIHWPKQINGHIPRVDGALLVYDVTAKDSLRDLPKTLAALNNSGLPTILVANKCDVDEEHRQLDTQIIADHHYFKPCVASYDLSASDPESANTCLNAIIRAAAAYRADNGAMDPAMPRRRAQSAANILEATHENDRPLSVASKHSRASSDLSVLQALPVPVSEHSSRSGSRFVNPRSSHSSIGEEEDPAKRTVSSQLRSTGVRLDRAPSDSFLDIDASDSESFRYSEDVPILQRNDEAPIEMPKPAGVSFDELVDRLLALKMTKADNQFAEIFLCLYRKFAAPGELFAAILTRLDRVRDDRTAHYLSKTATQLRIIEMVAKWVSLYPGDFARPTTRQSFVEFIQNLSTEPIFFLAAQQMRRNVECNVTEDDDTGWDRSDDVADDAAGDTADDTAGPFASTPSLSRDPSSLSELSFGVGVDLNDKLSSSTADLSYLDQGSAYSTHFQYNSPQEYEREAALCEPSQHFPLSKVRHRMFMEVPDDEIAEELTRIDWIMFSSIRIRDFVRHVSFSGEQRERFRSLHNVNRMIHHFNHVAKWVASMILLRDKVRHRAGCLEKFMNIATKLRIMNNYNGLAAVLAGINSVPIHRLQLTRSLVAVDVQKRFARLVILMGTQKSHFAYRLAWENSSFPRIPFVPLHRRDLVSAEEGSKTLIGGEDGGRINWKKFEVLGEVLLPMMRSQGTPYPNMRRNEAIRELVLDCRLPADDEELYQRSEQIEAPIAPGGEGYRRKFAWLRMGM